MLRPTPLVLALALLAPLSAAAQAPDPAPGWRLGLGVGLLRIDDLAGTPVVPAVSFTKAGRKTLVTANLAWINDAGFYGLTALAADVGLGLRATGRRVEGSLAVGPSGLLGGDGDGTPYYRAGAHLSGRAIGWLAPGLGVFLEATGRVWVSYTDDRLAPSVVAGVVVRL